VENEQDEVAGTNKGADSTGICLFDNSFKNTAKMIKGYEDCTG